MNFGEKLRMLRKDKGLSQAEAALMITSIFPEMQCSQTGYGRWEQRSDTPRGNILDVICKFYGVGVLFFFGADNNPTCKYCGAPIEEMRL